MISHQILYQKLLRLLALTFTGILMAAAYGALHDQVSYTVAPEYFSLIKFNQFRIAPAFHNRIGVALVGIGATWWVGFLMSQVLGWLIFWRSTPEKMYRLGFAAFLWVLLIGAGIGLLGLGIGWWIMEPEAMNWYPPGTTDERAFTAVAMMHNFSYLGGLAGLGYSVWKVWVRTRG